MSSTDVVSIIAALALMASSSSLSMTDAFSTSIITATTTTKQQQRKDGGNIMTPPFISTTRITGVPTTTQLFGLADRVATQTDYGSFTTEGEVRGLFKVSKIWHVMDCVGMECNAATRNQDQGIVSSFLFL